MVAGVVFITHCSLKHCVDLIDVMFITPAFGFFPNQNGNQFVDYLRTAELNWATRCHNNAKLISVTQDKRR